MSAFDPRLGSTAFVDHEHPRVRELVARATGGERDTRGRVRALFEAVRDGIRYDPYQTDLARPALSASATLERGAGFCVPKAIVYAAALRAIGVPARLAFADVTNHLATRRLLETLRSDLFVFHGFVVAEIDGRQVKATPAFDRALCARFGVAPLEFDGTADAMLQPFDASGRAFLEYRRDRGVHDDLPYEAMVAAWREAYPHLFGGALGALAP